MRCPSWRWRGIWWCGCKQPHPGTLFGKGKLEELRVLFEAEEIELVLIDGPVSPVQQRNLEKAWGLKLLDRTGSDP